MDKYDTIEYIDGELTVELSFSREDGTLWISIDQMAIMFGRDRTAISRHIKRIYHEGGIKEGGTRAKNARMVSAAGRIYQSDLYSLEIVMEISRRIKSKMGDKLLNWFRTYLDSKNENAHPIVVFDNGKMSIDVVVSPEEETIWLTQKQIADLYETTQQNASLHISNILSDGEVYGSVHKESLYTASDGKTYVVALYNLDMVLAVGYRVKSARAIEFRRWANTILKRYLLKGYVLNEQRLLPQETSIVELSKEVLTLEEKVKTNDIRIQRLEEIARHGELEKEAVFYSGQFIETRDFFTRLFSKAKNIVIIIDPYADSKVLVLLMRLNKEVNITLIRGSQSKLSDDDINAFIAEHGPLRILESEDFHDRFVFVDDSCYLVGASFNYMGKKTFAIMKMSDEGVINGLRERIDACKEYTRVA